MSESCNGLLGTLIERIDNFIDDTPLKLGWRIAEAVEAHNSAIVDREYVEWLHVRAFLQELLNILDSGIKNDSMPVLPPAPPQGGVQDIARIAWTCIKECADHEHPPVMCLKHQLEAEALLAPAPSQEPTKFKERAERAEAAFEEFRELEDKRWHYIARQLHDVICQRDEARNELAKLVADGIVVAAAASPSAQEQDEQRWQLIEEAIRTLDLKTDRSR